MMFLASIFATAWQIFVVVFMYLIVPALGFVAYLRVCQLLPARLSSSLIFAELFFLFLVYGGWLLVLLTQLLWKWSGMAFLGWLFLLFPAPILMLPVCLHLRSQRGESAIHLRAYQASLGYFPFVAALFITMFLYAEIHP